MFFTLTQFTGYSLSASNNCSSTSQTCSPITVSSVKPGIPGVITGPATVCKDAKDVNYSVASVPNAVAYNWTVPAGASITKGQGTNSITATFAVNSGTLCVSAENACGASLGSCEIITVDPTAAVGTVGQITGPKAVCANQSGVSYSIPKINNASTYLWTVPTGVTITSGQGTNTITVAFTTTSGSICVSASNNCSSSAQNCFTFTIDPSAAAIPGGISGITSVCSGQAGEAYSVSNVANASFYTWTVPSGAVITTGQGTNSITLTFGSSTGTVCVSAGNSCGNSLPSCKTVTVSPSGMIGSIGAISGSFAVCTNQSLVKYSTIPVLNATTYNWSVPAGATITSGQGTSTITVTFSSSSGNICVDASNSCSATKQSCEAITVASAAPVIPSGITGVLTVCSGQSGAVYNVPPVANATVYTWTTPPGGTVTAGQGTTAATITFGNTSGNICVTAGNACGTSLPGCQAISVNPNPALGTIGNIIGSKTTCANLTNVTYIIPAVANAANYKWTVPTAASITAGQGTNTITVSFGNVSGNICVEASNSCGTSPQSCIAVTVSPIAPSIPAGITGTSVVCTGQVGNYSITPVTNALSYSWSVQAGATITTGQGTTNTVITFGNTSGNICVSASNGCGTSLQNCKSITVSSAVLTVSTTVTNTSNSSVCDGSAIASPSSGTGPYTYAWTPSGATTSAVSGLCFGSHTVCITSAGGCVTCKNVYVSSPTAITELTDNGTIKVFPNPANDYIFIEGTLSGAANLQINILNMFGQRVMDKSLHADGEFTDKISIGNIPTGIYFIEVRSGEFIKNTKIIKIQ